MIPILLEIFRQKKNALMLLAVLLLCNMGVLVGINSYLSPTATSLQLKWSELRRKVADTGSLDINALYKQGQADLSNITNRVPAKRHFPRVLGDILDTAASNNVSSGNISYKQEVVKDQKLLAYVVTMNVNGSYAGVKSFLADILVAEELIVIDNLTISQSDRMTENVTMGLNMTVYMREGA
jgi:type IV pilus assembly protein PilO